MKLTFIETRNKLNSFVIGVLLTSMIYPTLSFASLDKNRPIYLGIDAVYSKMGFKKDYGDNIFSKKMIPGANFVVGYMFMDNFGVEVGYEIDKSMKRTETVYEGDKVTGADPIDAVTLYEKYATKLNSQKHQYLGFLAKKNIGCNNFISLMLGVSFSHIKAQWNLFDDGLPGTVNLTRTFSKHKAIALIRGTFEHKFNSNFGVRALIAWRNTSRFNIKSNENPAAPTEIRLKDTVSLGLGVSYYIL